MFDYFVSLGWYCGMGGSLAKYGFRSNSDPFDWYYSDLKGVLHFIETDFSDFLLRENIEVVPDNPLEFKDIKYGLHFNHDVKQDFDNEYADIREKYMRRIARFRIKIKSPTCFLRAVRDENELKYIANNQDYINRIIKKSNDANEIVFLIPKWLEIPKDLLSPFFVLNFERYPRARENLRRMLDGNDDVIDFLQSNITVKNIASNLMWDSKSELEKRDMTILPEFDRLKAGYSLIKRNYALAIRLLNDDLDFARIPSKSIIYGAGNIGKAFYNKCSMACSFECFIDKYSKEKEYRGLPILQLDRINEIKSKNFIVTSSYDMVNIKEWFSKHYPDVNLISIDSLFVG